MRATAATAATGETATSHSIRNYDTAPPRKQRVAPQPIHQAEKLKTSAPERITVGKGACREGYGQNRGLLFSGRAEVVLGLRLPSCSIRPWELAASAGRPCFLESYAVSTYRNRRRC